LGLSLSPLDLRASIAQLSAARSVTVLCHVQPDADTVGSGLALGLALTRRGARVQVAFAEPAELPLSLEGMPGGELLTPPDQVRPEVDLLVTVDVGSRERLGSLAKLLPKAGRVLVIDHHLSNTRYGGGTHLIDATADSTTAVLAILFDEWGVPIDRELAYLIYAGLVADTGSFRWCAPQSHQLAYRLLSTGIDGDEITRRLLDTHPFAWLPMMASVLGGARLAASAAGGLGLVYAVVHQSDRRGLGADEVESVINVVRTAAEAEVAAVFKEGADGQWVVSLRAKHKVDVAEVAKAFGGGGHQFASGYTVRGPLDQAVAALISRLG
jgi:phosphoesterase RecJ-like protein